MTAIRTRETWKNGLEVSFEVEAFEADTKLFVPGATVTRDLRFGKLQVMVGWASSSSSDRSVANARSQLEVMTEAVKLADELIAGEIAWRLGHNHFDDRDTTDDCPSCGDLTDQAGND